MLELRGSGENWMIVDAITGKQHGKPYRHRDRAADSMKHLERRLKRKKRPCISCGSQFDSEGPHNRQCNKCRKNTGGLI